jgi:hypothetical protein
MSFASLPLIGSFFNANPFQLQVDEGRLDREVVRLEAGFGGHVPVAPSGLKTFCANFLETAKASTLLWAPTLSGFTVGSILGGFYGDLGRTLGGKTVALWGWISDTKFNHEHFLTGGKIGASLVGGLMGGVYGAMFSQWATKMPIARDSTRKLIQNTKVLGKDSLNAQTGCCVSAINVVSMRWAKLKDMDFIPSLLKSAVGFQFVRTGLEFLNKEIERPGILNEDLPPLDMHAVELDASAIGAGLIVGGTAGVCLAPTILTMIATSTVVSSLVAGMLSVLKPNFLRG